MIKEQIEQAAKPKTPLPLPVERRSLIIIIYHTCTICTCMICICTCIFNNTTDCENIIVKKCYFLPMKLFLKFKVITNPVFSFKFFIMKIS